MITLLFPLLATLANPLPVQEVTSCQVTNPRLERLAEAIQRGDVEYVRVTFDEGADVHETWRDLPAQVCRSLLLRSIWHGQEEIFRLLLERGADPLSVPSCALNIPVRDGRIEMVRTLLGLGLKPHSSYEILVAALESKDLAMLELMLSSGVPVEAWTFPLYYFSDDVARYLVPRHLHPNDKTILRSHCEIEELFSPHPPRLDRHSTEAGTACAQRC